jgi:hypothetical protein
VNGSARPGQPQAGELSGPALGQLTLPGLRSYRQTLIAEENRASYWRRLVQARLDLTRTALRGGRAPRLSDLPRVLVDQPAASRRSALLSILPADDIPPLPDLADLWRRDLTAAGVAEWAVAEQSLAAAERELSAYRAALHARIGAATGELVRRYRDDPMQCLCALPQPPGERRRRGA